MNQAGKTVEKVEVEKKVENVNSQKVNETLDKLLSGKEITEIVETERGNFTMKYPLPVTLRQIEMLLASRFDGVDFSKLPNDIRNNSKVYATLDVVIVKAPTWWDNLESSEFCPDDALIIQLYRRYLRFYTRVQTDISGVGGTPEESSDRPEEKTMGNGAFSNLANRPEIPGVK